MRQHFFIKVKEFDQIALNKSTPKYCYFSYFSMKTYVLGTHLKHLAEALLTSTHNICFHGGIRKLLSGYPFIDLELRISTRKRAKLRVNIFSTSRLLILQNR